jgi:hypothetical protein
VIYKLTNHIAKILKKKKPFSPFKISEWREWFISKFGILQPPFSSSLPNFTMSRHRKAPAYAEQVLTEFNADKDLKKVNNAVIGFERRFYDHLYPESAVRDTLGERVCLLFRFIHSFFELE